MPPTYSTDDHNLLIRLDERSNGNAEKLDELLAHVKTLAPASIVTDHESRLRAVEKSKWIERGAWAVVLAGVEIASKLWK